MLSNILHSRLVAAVVSCMALVLSSSPDLVNAEDLCSIVPYSYTGAKLDHPELTSAIKTMGNYAIASWFTDRQTPQERSDMMSELMSQCSEDSRLSIVVYGIPNKDCAAGYSSGGSVTSSDDYKVFLKELTDAVGDRKVLYVVEPDALGLLTQDGGCGASAGYLDNLKVAVEALSKNENSELYIDIGYWMLANSDSAGKVATAMQDIGTCGRVKGVTINTSNYRSNDECTTYCTNFQTAMGSTSMTCAVDTSRNYNGNPTTDWCNVATAGIGKPPSSSTGISNIDYFMWIKPPGESDGTCLGGPEAGSFYLEGFTQLWDQGYFVSEQGMSKIGDSSSSYTPSSDDSSANQGQNQPYQTTAPPTSTSATGSSSWIQEDTAAGTVGPAGTTSTEVPTATTATIAPTFAPETESSAPSTTMPATTSPVTTDQSDTAQQSYSTPKRSACKAKKRLRSL
ncbi:Glycoside hydrolase [Phytophthora megakarya]|uniref:Glycoside hydrolase n=1 Tax=Phytophthora megakarya TaxID=4795 RepID=A0A225WSD3_9STRA|nr:Glycoside hydrolase [Phytophthora megakarya]